MQRIYWIVHHGPATQLNKTHVPTYEQLDIDRESDLRFEWGDSRLVDSSQVFQPPQEARRGDVSHRWSP